MYIHLLVLYSILINRNLKQISNGPYIESNDRLDWSRVLKPSGQPRMGGWASFGGFFFFWGGGPWGSQVSMAAVAGAGAAVGVGWAGLVLPAV